MQVPQAQNQVREQYTAAKLDNTKLPAPVKADNVIGKAVVKGIADISKASAYATRFDQAQAEKDRKAKERKNKADEKIYAAMEKELEKSRKSKMDELNVNLTGMKNDLLSNPETGYLNTQGENSLNESAKLREDFQKQTDEVLSGLSDEELKKRYSLSRDKTYSQIDLQANRHQSREMTLLENERSVAKVTTLKNDAVLNYNVPSSTGGVLGDNKKEINDELRLIGKKQGKDKAAINNSITAMNGEINSSVLARMIDDKKVGTAKEFLQYTKDKGEYTADQLKDAEKMIDGASRDADAYNLVSQVQGMEYGKAIDQIRTLSGDDVAKADNAVRRFKAQYSEQETAKKMDQIKYYQGRYDEVMQGKTEGFKLSSVDYLKLDDNQQRALMKLNSDMVKAEMGEPEKKVTDFETWNNALHSKDFVNIDVAKLYDEGKLSLTDAKAMSKMQKDQGMHKAAQSLSSWQTDLVREAGAKDKPEDAASIREQTNAFLNEYPKDKRNDPAVREKIRKMLFTPTTRGLFGGKKAWEAVRDRQTFTAKDKTGDVPKSAQTWFNEKVEGVTYQGWSEEVGNEIWIYTGGKYPAKIEKE